MSRPAPHPAAGFLLGVMAVALFGATLPVTRWTLSPELSPVFVTFARVVGAAVPGVLVLLHTRSPLPRRDEWGPLVVAAAGNAVLYPLSLAWALQRQSAAHVAVITALLPLATAAAAALATRTARGHPRFWACAVASSALVAWFSLRRAGGGFVPALDDAVVVGGVLAASVGYVQGARVTARLGAERVIGWVTVITLPLALPVALATWPAQPVGAAAWSGLAWLSLVSMGAAMFVWYRALDWGGPLRVSQVQAFQPFFSIAIAWPLLGERPDAATLAFAAAVVALVALGTRR